MLGEFTSLSSKNFVPHLPVLPFKDWYQIDVKQVLGPSRSHVLLTLGIMIFVV